MTRSSSGLWASAGRLCVALAALGCASSLAASRWVLQPGTTTEDDMSGAAVLADGSILAGGASQVAAFTWCPWLVRLDADGRVTDSVYFVGTPFATTCRVLALADGGALVLSDAGPGAHPSWLARLDSTLVITWQEWLDRLHAPRALAPLPSGNVLVGGMVGSVGPAWLGELDLGGALVWQQEFTALQPAEVRAVAASAAGGIVGAACVNCTSAVVARTWIFKLDATRSLAWQLLLRAPSGVQPRALVAMADGGAIVAGEIYEPSGHRDVVVLRVDGSGNVLWQQTLIDGYSQQAFALMPQPGGGVFVAGAAREASYDGTFVAQVDDAGSLLWAVNTGSMLGGIPSDTSLVTAADGDVVVVSSADVNLSGPGTDGLVFKMAPDLTISGCSAVRAWPFVSADAGLTIAATTETMTVASVTAVPADTVPTAVTCRLTEHCRDAGVPLPREVSPPASTQPLLFIARTDMTWEDAAPVGADTFDLYRGDIASLRAGDRGACLLSGIATSGASDLAEPATGAWFYLVTGRNAAGEGPMGDDSFGQPRVNGTPCP